MLFLGVVGLGDALLEAVDDDVLLLVFYQVAPLFEKQVVGLDAVLAVGPGAEDLEEGEGVAVGQVDGDYWEAVFEDEEEDAPFERGVGGGFEDLDLFAELL